MDDTRVIVLTGGPCGGKTSLLNFLQEEIIQKGFDVYVIDEVATELFDDGVVLGKKGVTIRQFQKYLIPLQIAKEHCLRGLASCLKNPKRLIICDRGAIDGMAYVGRPAFTKIAHELGFSLGQLGDERYDGVFHLVSTAVDAAHHYTTKNNPRRRETRAEAAQRDHETLACWVGHPHVRVIDNSTDLEGKKRRLLAAVCRILGIPVPLEIERRYLVEMPDIAMLTREVDGAISESRIEQIYLQNTADVTRRIRKRTHNGFVMYTETWKWDLASWAVRQEEERRLDSTEYQILTRQLHDASRQTIHKRRHCFLWENQYFELDMFTSPKRLRGLAILEIELTELNDRVTLPPFLNIGREITGEPQYSNYHLAKMGYMP